jgi:signal transduction histidine kinase
VNDDIIKNTQELEAKYETEKKELKIKNLTHESEIQKYKSKQKLWIIFSLIIGIIGITIFTYLQYKNYQNKKKFILQEKQLSIAEERIRIANDMHDDVGAGLSRIRYISTILKNNEGIKIQKSKKL